MRATRRRRHRRRLHDSDGCRRYRRRPYDSDALVARKTGSYSGRGRLVVAGDAVRCCVLSSPGHWFFAERSYDLDAIGGRRALGVWRKQARDGLRSLVGAMDGGAERCARPPGHGGPVRSRRFSSNPQQAAAPSEAGALDPRNQTAKADGGARLRRNEGFPDDFEGAGTQRPSSNTTSSDTDTLLSPAATGVLSYASALAMAMRGIGTGIAAPPSLMLTMRRTRRSSALA